MTNYSCKWAIGVMLTLTLAFTALSTNDVYAVPAKPGVHSVQQADGTSLNIILNGDEYFAWRTTESGYPVVENSDGFFYYATVDFSGKITATSQRVSIDNRMQAPPAGVSSQSISSIASMVNAQQRALRSEDSEMRKAAAADTKASVSSYPSVGAIRSAVILVEFSDVSFSLSDPYTSFYNQLNKENYAVEGATGSARDYFDANSRGQFDGQFDVYGPYTLSNTREYYGGNNSYGSDSNPSDMTLHAVTLANADGVDFSLYDYDNDGYIDNVFVYYAGHNEAEGGPSDAVWPHKWYVSSKPTFNGKTLYVYACTSELRGSSGTTIAGIGTFCHEFSHVFGLADHYDTDSINGDSVGTGTYDLMCSGSYNNNGNTPPLHTGLELQMIGWVEPTTIETGMEIEIEPLNSGKVYKIETDVEDEYFLIENRSTDAIVWENYIPSSGLIISHVDRSTNYMSKWSANGPNNDTSHECYYFVPSSGATMDDTNWGEVPYPYQGNTEWTSTSTPAAKSWSGNDLEIGIVDITKLSDGNVTFKAIKYSDDINVLISVDKDAAYVGQTLQFSASTYPVQDDSSVTWSSSDTTVATIDEDGCAIFIGAGTTTFTATLNSDSSYSSSLTYSVIDLLGANGFVTDVDTSAPLEGAELRFYAVTRSMESVAGVASAVYTRSTTSAYYKATCDETGEYRIELDEGYYEVELSCSCYNDDFQIIYVASGITELDFTLSSIASTVDTIIIEPSQTTATIYWNPQDYTAFEIVYSKGSAYVNYEVYLDGENQYTIDELETDRQYTVTVSGRIGTSSSYKELYSTTFTTLSQTTTIPMVQIDTYEYTAGETLTLNMLNSDSKDTITWYIDDEMLENNKYIMEVGEHTIKATVERGTLVYRILRKINVN
ncbi:MAG: M6 family metalloprotease domain-containing protein [Rikenellaceae bacterium]